MELHNETYLLAVDIGTTTIRSVLYDSNCEEQGSYQETVATIYSTGNDDEVLVEIDPDRMFQQFLRVIERVYRTLPPNAKVNIGLCTQRNSIVLWNKKTRKEETGIICWNDKRANKICHQLNNSFILKALNFGGGLLHFITRKNRFLAAQRLKFLGAMVSHRLIVTINRSEKLKQMRAEGDLCFGSLETWLLMRSSRSNKLCVEASNISPSGMFDPWIGAYNNMIMKIIGFPTDMLSPIVDSNLSDLPKLPIIDRSHFGAELKIGSIIADQQAAMFGCGTWERGDVKITLGTGTFVNVHTGKVPYASMSGLYPIVGWRINGETDFVAEGNAHDTAVVLHWAQSIGLFTDVRETSDIAKSVPNSNGVVFVPAFCGIQTPINDETACSGFLCIRPDTTKVHMVRAVLESIAFRVYQIYSAAESEVYININSPVRICGGVSNNDFICQCISDLLGRKVERMTGSDHVAARGVALLAGYSQNLWSKDQMKELITVSDTFEPCIASRLVLMKSFETWKKAVDRCLGFYQ
uniref:Glycerol kinase 5 n=1 Tax=Caenorhabditis tropicalis TaxID=1561998 RepID=A0A1I7T888_9PELO